MEPHVLYISIILVLLSFPVMRLLFDPSKNSFGNHAGIVYSSTLYKQSDSIVYVNERRKAAIFTLRNSVQNTYLE